jgi:sarcosine oxidase
MNIQYPSPADPANALWAHTSTKASANPPLVGDVAADVTIIGAGFTGLRAALHLAEAGTRVTVLDAGDVAFGASGRTGGQVNPMLPFNGPKELQKILGSTYFERLSETSLGSADALFDLVKKYQIDCQARQHGWLRVCHTARALADARTGLAEWNKCGADMHVVTGDELTAMSGTKAYGAGVITPKGGAVQPRSLALGLASAAKGRGATIHGKSAVTDLSRVDGKWVAKTAGGSVTSDWVIVATNGYSDSLIPKLASSIIPLTPIQIATDPLPQDVIGSVLPQGHTISDSRRVIMYARREPDDRMVYGGCGNMQRNGEIGGFEWLQRDAERVFPQLKGVTWTFRWGGRIAVTEDHLPHLHEPQPGLVVGLGYNGRGVAMSHVMGQVMAERVLGADANSLAFPVTQVKPMTFRQIKGTGLGTAIWFMRFMDYLETR